MIVLMPEFLRSSGELRLILFGFLVVILMGLSRGGIAGLAPALMQRLERLRPSSAAKSAETGELKL